MDSSAQLSSLRRAFDCRSSLTFTAFDKQISKLVSNYDAISDDDGSAPVITIPNNAYLLTSAFQFLARTRHESDSFPTDSCQQLLSRINVLFKAALCLHEAATPIEMVNAANCCKLIYF